MNTIKEKPKRRDFRSWGVFIVLMAAFIISSNYFHLSDVWFQCIVIVLASLFVLSLVLRNSLAFKGYFLSPLNLFTFKQSTSLSFDLNRELMLDKLIEVINDSAFRLKAVDREKYELLATSRITFKSWGENLYISLIDEGGKTRVELCSATIFQVVDWGKNQKNFELLEAEIEKSFTI